MNVPSKPASIDVETHGNFIDGREVEAGAVLLFELGLRSPLGLAGAGDAVDLVAEAEVGAMLIEA